MAGVVAPNQEPADAVGVRPDRRRALALHAQVEFHGSGSARTSASDRQFRPGYGRRWIRHGTLIDPDDGAPATSRRMCGRGEAGRLRSAPVEDEDLPDVESFGDRDDTGVGGAESQVRVALDKLG